MAEPRNEEWRKKPIPSAHSEKLTILCIDDDQQCLSLRAEVLRREGFNIMNATDCLAGIALAKAHKVDAVLLDYSMPAMDGEEVARVLRHDFPDLPIILCSGWDEIPERVFTLVDAFVTKGDGVEFLIAAIREVSMRMQGGTAPRIGRLRKRSA